MTQTPRSFNDELLEIIEDVQFEIGMLEDTFDQEMRTSIIQKFADATKAMAKTHGMAEAVASAAVAMYTHGFYVGREHAARGYTSPRGRTDGISDITSQIPDTPEGL